MTDESAGDAVSWDDYRTAEETALYDSEAERVGLVLDAAVAAIADMHVTAALGESQQRFEAAVDAVWDGLRDGLDGEARLRAIVELLSERGHRRGKATLRGLRSRRACAVVLAASCVAAVRRRFAALVARPDCDCDVTP